MAGPTPTPQPTQATTQPGFTPKDLQDITNGNMLPALERLLVLAMADYQDQTTAPKRDDPQYWQYDPTSGQPIVDAQGNHVVNAQYAADSMKWEKEATQTIATLTQQINQTRKLGNGVVALPNGAIITQDLLNSDDPYVAAQARDAYQNNIANTFNGWNNLMNQMGLDQFNVDTQATTGQNNAKLAQFNAQLSELSTKSGLDQAAVNRAVQAVNRQLSGMQEARQEADTITSAAMQAAPWATNGQQSFTGGDLGAGISTIMRQAGVNPGKAIVNFPSTVTIDPAAIMAQRQQQLGVTGSLPLIPELSVNSSMVPQAPQLGMPPNAPQFQPPMPPSYTNPGQMQGQQVMGQVAQALPGILARMFGGAPPAGIPASASGPPLLPESQNSGPSGPVFQGDPNTLPPELRALYGL